MRIFKSRLMTVLIVIAVIIAIFIVGVLLIAHFYVTPDDPVYPAGTFKRTQEFTQISDRKSSDFDCDDFADQDEAQYLFEKEYGPEYDWYNLDANGDGQACETHKYGTKTDKQCLEEAVELENNYLIKLGYTKQADGSWKNKDGNYPSSEESNRSEVEMTGLYDECIKN